MNFEIVPVEQRTELRQKYIDKFIDTKREHYLKYIKKLNKFSDGLCYTGYLWDCLKNNESFQYECTIDKAIEFLTNKISIYVMWDIHSVEMIHIKRILTNIYPRDTIINVKAEELCHTIRDEWETPWGSENSDKLFFPEDIYTFDDTFKWSVIYTHEGWEHNTKPELSEDEYIRICFIVNN